MFAPRLGSCSIPGIIPSFSDSSIPCVFFDVGTFDLGTGKGKQGLIVRNQVNWNSIQNNMTSLTKIPEALIEPYMKVQEQVFSESEPRMINVRRLLKRVSLKNSVNNGFKYQMMENL